MAARCCASIRAVSASAIVHCVRGVRMTVHAPHQLMTHGLAYLNSELSEDVSGTAVWKNRLSNFQVQNITQRET